MKSSVNQKVALNFKDISINQIGTFLQTILGYKEVYTEPGVKAYKLMNNDLLEIHGSGSDSLDFLFNQSRQVVSFAVPDFGTALDIIHKTAFKMLYCVKGSKNDLSFCYIEIEPNLIIGFYQDVTVNR